VGAKKSKRGSSRKRKKNVLRYGKKEKRPPPSVGKKVEGPARPRPEKLTGKGNGRKVEKKGQKKMSGRLKGCNQWGAVKFIAPLGYRRKDENGRTRKGRTKKKAQGRGGKELQTLS